MSRSHNWVAARVAARKAERPDLYCRDCLWMTGGGQCPRHGGPAWSPERQVEADAKSRAPKFEPGVVALAPEERGVLLSVAEYGRPAPVLRHGPRGAVASRLISKGVLVRRWSSSDDEFDYYGLTALGEEVARTVGAS